ncbi:hypothetical protein DID88_007618 [Monilinia fructigena]|uniref:Cyanovirin-N domain-containing protein n=1 Tax=Monilinia fructigena TaxID=38457 RepID=A0A395J2V3_9HELO|nr:hypothetical protein DID88_007618 [Monilinia fructigena]
MAKLFSALLVSILLSIAHASGGFLSQASCNGSSFQFIAAVEVSDAPDFFITVTPNLSGLCPASSGQMKNSTLNLNKCLGNNNAHLIWKKDGMFQNSCGCSLEIPNLCCGCGKANGGTVPSGICIDLNEGVAADNGTLNCNVLPTSV